MLIYGPFLLKNSVKKGFAETQIPGVGKELPVFHILH